MANRMKGEASFAHDGQDYLLRITMDVLLAAEDETGASLIELAATSRIGWLASLLRHALAAGGGKLLPRGEAAELLLKAEGAREMLMKAFVASMPEPEAKGEDDAGNGAAASA
jgi:hypothetical protein